MADVWTTLDSNKYVRNSDFQSAFKRTGAALRSVHGVSAANLMKTFKDRHQGFSHGKCYLHIICTTALIIRAHDAALMPTAI